MTTRLYYLALVLAGIASAGTSFTVEPYSAMKFPTFPISKEAGPYAGAFSVLTNQSDIDIAAIKMIWRDGNGKPIFIRDQSMYRQNTHRGVTPIVGAHSSMLLKPDDSYLHYLVAGSHATVDAVIFADGLVSGPDTTNYENDQQSEYLAGKQIAARVKNGEFPAAIKTDVESGVQLRLAAARAAGSNVTMDWPAFFASQINGQIPAGSPYTQKQVLDAFVWKMEHLAPMPNFHRGE